MTSRNIECSSHGVCEATYVCRHIWGSGDNVPSVGFNYSSLSNDAYPNAWCDACDDFLMANGGDWNDITEAFARVSLLCSGCYLQRKAAAQEAGKLTEHS